MQSSEPHHGVGVGVVGVAFYEDWLIIVRVTSIRKPKSLNIH